MRAVQKVTLAEAVIGEILEQVKAGVLVAGDRLPPEKELMKTLGVSRPVLREALRSLEMAGAIEIRPGLGAVVRDPRTDPMINPEVLSLVLQKGRELDQLHEVRLINEVAIAGLAAERATPEDLDRLETCVEALRQAKDLQATIEPAHRFHLALAEAAHNPLLLQVIMPVLQLLQAHIQERGNPLFSLEDEYLLHRDLLRAVQSGEPEPARAEMERHLNVSLRRWFAVD